MKKNLVFALAATTLIFAMPAFGAAATSEDEGAAAVTENAEAELELPERYSAPASLVSVTDISSYMILAPYNGVEIENVIPDVTDEDVQAVVDQALANYPTVLSTGAVENGDTAVIDFVGKKDGEAFDGGSATDYFLAIGSGTFIPGFEEGVIGMEVGETKDIPLTFPENYSSAELAGQDVIFTVTVNSIRRPAELTNSWVMTNTTFGSVEEYLEAIRANMIAYYDMYREQMKMELGFQQVYENTVILEYPEEDIAAASEEYMDVYREYAAQGDMELSEFLESQGATMEDFTEYARQYAESKVKQDLIVQAILGAEGLSTDDEVSRRILSELIAAYDYTTVAELEENYGADNVYESVCLLRVEQFIADNCVLLNPEDAAAEEIGGGDVAEEPEAGEEGVAPDETLAAAAQE